MKNSPQKTNETREVLKGHQAQTGRALDTLEQRLRDDNADLLAKNQEVRQSLMAALETSDTKLRDDLSELVRDIGGKSRDQAHRLKLSVEGLD